MIHQADRGPGHGRLEHPHELIPHPLGRNPRQVVARGSDLFNRFGFHAQPELGRQANGPQGADRVTGDSSFRAGAQSPVLQVLQAAQRIDQVLVAHQRQRERIDREVPLPQIDFNRGSCSPDEVESSSLVG